jgi:hypothetical protein
MGYRNYSVANGLIVDKLGNGDFTTIQAAINAATTGQTIFLRPGTYTENPVLKSGVDLVAFVTDGDIPNVIINGACTYSSAGTVGISGIELQTNSGFLLAVTGSAASVVYIIDSYINCLNNTGISFSSSSPASAINLVNCSGNIGTTGIGIYSSSSAGGINFEYTTFSNTGGSTTASTNSAGTVGFSYSSTSSPISISGGTLVFDGGFINTTTQNVTCLALTGSSVVAIHLDSGFSSGTASAISIGIGSTLTNYSMMEISSTNTNAITGAGTIQYGNIVYGASSSTNNVTTQNGLQQSTGILSLPASSLTEYGVLFSNSTTGLIASTAAGSATQVLTSNGSSAPTFQAVGTEGTFTPTMVGQSVAGATTYSAQAGNYVTFPTTSGKMCTVWGEFTTSAQTGTGNVLLGGLPFAIRSIANQTVTGTIAISSSTFTWSGGATQVVLQGINGSTTANIVGQKSSGAALIAMVNTPVTMFYSFSYLI